MGSAHSKIRIDKLLLVTAELALACFVMVRFELDLAKALAWDLLWIVPVFVAHALMPHAWRRAFLLAVTAVLLSRVLGVTAAAYAIAVGLFLIGLAHLPVAFRWRVLAIVAVATCLALVQAAVIPGGGFLRKAIPILGGIFMFRMIFYLYDIRHEKPGATPLERISYFFLLPAPLAPFFPTLDYQVYRRAYYQRDAFETYQLGILWISRGIVHLVLYRVIYHFFSPPAELVTDLSGVAAYCLSGYLIYLRVSGLFHILSGTLRLFGYAIPDTHRLYFFAHNFSDYWRRINIYWTDFMTKIVFYPSYTALKKTRLGHQGKLVLATVAVFAATTVLHAYQTFWIRGTFTFHATDLWFWGILGLLVITNNLVAARAKPAAGADSGWDWRAAAVVSLKALGMFVLFAVLWTMWSSGDWGEFVDVMRQGTNATSGQLACLVLFPLAAVVLGTFGQWLAQRGVHIFEERPALARSIASTAVPLVALGLAWQYHSAKGLPGWAGSKFDEIWIDQPSLRDEVSRERSYYEGLLAGGPSVGAEEEATVKVKVPDIRNLLYRERWGPKEVWGARWSTNRWGMRDQYYSKAKKPGSYRIAFSGASYVAGRGVADGTAFESVLEDKLNAGGATVESLNFATSASCTIQRLADLELRIADFDPDAFFIVCHGAEAHRNIRKLAELITAGKEDLTFPFVEDLCNRAGVQRGDSRVSIIRALTPFSDELMRWTYTRIAEVCREKEITPVWIFLPNSGSRNIARAEEGQRFAEQAGLATIVLEDAYGGRPADEVSLGELDDHPNELGHRLIAEALFRQLTERHEELGLPAEPFAAD